MRNAKADRIKRICQVYLNNLNQGKVEILCWLLSQYHNLTQYFNDFFWQLKFFPIYGKKYFYQRLEALRSQLRMKIFHSLCVILKIDLTRVEYLEAEVHGLRFCQKMEQCLN